MVKRSTTKHRGSRMHGRGKKRGRGAGLRGGRGHAGSMGNKLVHYMKYKPEHFAHRHGFKRPPEIVSKPQAINVGEIQDLVETFQEEGVAAVSGGVATIDLGAAGFDKLLGGGLVKTALKLKVKAATEKAIAKVEAAGGSVEVVAA